jgi:hypothetical protein
MKIIKGLMLLLSVGILAAGCYWTPYEGEAELSLILPKSITEKAPPELYYARIDIYDFGSGEFVKFNGGDDYIIVPMPSFTKAPQGVIPLKLPAGEYTLTIMMDIDGNWISPEYSGDSGPDPFPVLPAGRTKVVVTVS